MKKLLFVLTASFAVSSYGLVGLTTSIEPIMGYERVQKFLPTQHTVERWVFGARATAGFTLLSAEAEYTRASDTETFSSAPETIRDTEDRARLGLRSTLRIAGFFRFLLRAGAQANYTRHDITTSGVTVTTIDPIRYRPYAGAGVGLALGQGVSLNGDVTTVFHNFPNFSTNDYLVSLSLAVNFP